MINDNLNEKIEENYKILNRYNPQNLKRIKIFFLNIDENNNLQDIIEKEEKISNNELSIARLFFLLNEYKNKFNERIQLNQILKFNYPRDIFDLTSSINTNFLEKQNLSNPIIFQKITPEFADFQSIYLIFNQKKKIQNNLTRKININLNNKKRKQTKKSIIS